jgi:hypothetical protein
MKTSFLYRLFFFLSLAFLASCIDIFENDLSNSKVELLAPADEIITTELSNIFWWNYMEGALWYELQVVTPQFSNVTSLKLDTTIENNNFQFSLQPGVYQWRVRAFNGSSSTDFSTNSLTIIENTK